MATTRVLPQTNFFNEAAVDGKQSSLPEVRPQLIKSLITIVVECPPQNPWVDASDFKKEPQGLWTGPSSIAYLFFWLSKTHPEVEIEGRLPREWCLAYLDCGSDKLPIAGSSIGIKNEYMAYNTVNAIATADLTSVERVKTGAIAFNIEAPAVENEFFQGRAGILALLRLIRYWIPETGKDLNPVMDSIIEHCLQNQPWHWKNQPLLGAAHGSIGILTQIILCNPSYATRLESTLIDHLDAQLSNGNWHCRSDRPDIPEKPDSAYYTQFCHGAPGFVFSLIKLRPHFPSLHSRIDDSIKRARECIWKEGLLKKEPNLCHGIIGNALTLESPQRDHFMSFATAERIKAGSEDGLYTMSKDRYGLQWGEAGRAWGWMLLDVDSAEKMGWPAYTDV